MQYTHTVISPSEYINKGGVTFGIYAFANIRITSITFFGVYSTYKIDDNVQNITLICDYSSDSHTVNQNAQTLVFNVNQTLTPASTITFGLRLSGSGSFGLIEGVDANLDLYSETAIGIYSYTPYDVPHCMITYEVLDTPYLHDQDTNDGYFYFNGLAVGYSDYEGNYDWLIDTAKTINKGYPFIDGLATEYSDYRGFAKGLLIYRNNVRLNAYKNGVLLSAHNVYSEE